MPVTRTCGYRRMTWCEVSQPTLNLQLMTMAIRVNKQHLFDGQEVGSRKNIIWGGESKREKLHYRFIYSHVDDDDDDAAGDCETVTNAENNRSER